MGICGARGSDHHPTEGHFSLSLLPSVGFRPGVQGWQGKEKEGEREKHTEARDAEGSHSLAHSGWAS